MKRINVLDYGLKGDGSLETKSLQKIIDLYSKPDNVIYFPFGSYVLSTIHLRDDTHLYFEKGVMILGSENFDDYERDEKVDYPLYQDASHSFFHCSLFLGENVKNVSLEGDATIDMRSVWDEENVRNMVHRGAKCVALKECENVSIKGLTILHATDLAIYFAGCDNVEIDGIKMRVYIDGISPDNSKRVHISNCDVLSGDDGIVFKSSYSLNRLDFCKDIEVKNCTISSRCNAIKFGTESNGGFYGIDIHDIDIRNTRITGVSIESVDGGIIDNIKISNIKMTNVNAPLFIHLGKRLRGPKGRGVGAIKNIYISNITATGPYEPYQSIAWNYDSFKKGDSFQDPKVFGVAENISIKENDEKEPWQFTSNVCGLKERHLENISLSNIHMELDGGVMNYEREVRETAYEYPEVYVYGKVLPASGIYFRYVNDLTLKDVEIKTIHKDLREAIVVD